MRPLFTLFLCAACSVCSGCMVLDAGKSITSASLKIFRPRSTDYRDTVEETYVDEWQQVGSDARGDRPRETESDGLTRLTTSAKARAIERSLGVE